ncbi:hypothetical protein J6590_058212 [Homalodisca vitripennis]|nr:hypothetical protein J6590_058212 [Homalodisca vitripennis]
MATRGRFSRAPPGISTRSPARPPNTVVRFVRRTVRDEWLQAAEAKRDLDAVHISSAYSPSSNRQLAFRTVDERVRRVRSFETWVLWITVIVGEARVRAVRE